jgi:hypothetical protein
MRVFEACTWRCLRILDFHSRSGLLSSLTGLAMAFIWLSTAVASLGESVTMLQETREHKLYDLVFHSASKRQHLAPDRRGQRT